MTEQLKQFYKWANRVFIVSGLLLVISLFSKGLQDIGGLATHTDYPAAALVFFDLFNSIHIGIIVMLILSYLILLVVNMKHKLWGELVFYSVIMLLFIPLSLFYQVLSFVALIFLVALFGPFM